VFLEMLPMICCLQAIAASAAKRRQAHRTAAVAVAMAAVMAATLHGGPSLASDSPPAAKSTPAPQTVPAAATVPPPASSVAAPPPPSSVSAAAASATSAATLAGQLLHKLDFTYHVSWGGLGVGDMRIALKPADRAGCYRYTAETRPTLLVAALYGAPNETSLFCVVDGQIRSQRFESVLPSDNKQSYWLNFDWDNLTVTDNKGRTRKIPPDAIDSFALQQAVRLWVAEHAQDAQPPIAEFTMVDNKNLTHYKFKLSGQEKVETPAGTFQAMKLERIDNPDKMGRFWVAPARDFMPVVIETKNGGKPTVRMELAK
jgi:hypothetical protein